MTTTTTKGHQWIQLLVLMAAHGVADFYSGILTPILVPLRGWSGLSLADWVFITATMGLACNLFQLPIGHARATWRHPGLIVIGLLLACLPALTPLLPLSPNLWMHGIALGIVAGFGVACVHPEGLRAVHGLNRIAPSVATSVFMIGGFTGYASGAWCSAALVERWGLAQLPWLALAAGATLLALLAVRVRLPVENASDTPATRPAEMPILRFLPLFAITVSTSVGAATLATFLPTYLHERGGFSLSYGGLSVTLFGIGSKAGALTWGALAPRLGILRTMRLGGLIGATAMAVYLLLARRSVWMLPLLMLAAFALAAIYPLTISLARFAVSRLRMGQRMSLMVGGTWGLACLLLWALGPIAEQFGLETALGVIAGAYAIAAAGVWRMRDEEAENLHGQTRTDTEKPGR